MNPVADGGSAGLVFSSIGGSGASQIIAVWEKNRLLGTTIPPVYLGEAKGYSDTRGLSGILLDYL